RRGALPLPLPSGWRHLFLQCGSVGADRGRGDLHRSPDRCGDVSCHATAGAPGHGLCRFLCQSGYRRGGRWQGERMKQAGRKGRQALLVAGMHRSGTSALTRVLDLHGVSLGSELLEAAADNQAGFWENRRVVDFHERLLGVLGSSWDDPRELRHDWVDVAVSAGHLDELVELLDSEFGDADIWAVKDPRLCRVLPLWRMALDRLQIAPKLIFSLRDPGEVVGSLRQRNGLSAATGALLWLRYLAEPVQASLDLPHCAIGYHELLDDWRGCMARLASTLGIVWPVSSSECAAAVDGHLRGDLRHQEAASTRGLRRFCSDAARCIGSVRVCTAAHRRSAARFRWGAAARAACRNGSCQGG